jgi:thiol-disulfide isomerase/thioredoxin
LIEKEAAMIRALGPTFAVVMLSPCLGQEARPARPAPSLQSECDTLYGECMKAMKEYGDRTRKAKTNEEASSYPRPDVQAYAARFMAMAEAHPDDPAAVDALVRVILVDFYGAHWKDAIETIRTRYVTSPRIGPALMTIAYDTTPPEVESFLRAVLKDNSNDKVQAQAAVALSDHLGRLIGEAENMREHPDRFEHAVTRFGRDEVTRMRDRDTAAMRREMESLLESVVRDYPEAPGSRSDLGDTPSPAELAARRLRSLRDLTVGKPAPEIEGKDVDGKPMRLSDYRGKVVVLTFWATWCGPCVAMMPHERELIRRMEGKPFVLLGVNGDEDKERMRYQSKELQITWRSFYDGGPDGPISRSWDVRGWPMVVVLDRDGVIRYKGGNDEKKLDEAVGVLMKSDG